MKHLLADYDKDVKAAFEKLLRDVMDLREKNLEPEVHISLLRVIAGRCGSGCSGAAKRSKRALVFEALLKEKNQGLDITPTVAGHVFERLIGRSVDNRAMIQAFATAGRTAAEKSAVSAEDLSELEQKMTKQLQFLQQQMNAIRHAHNQSYKESVKASTRLG
jgi:hypothetical protein